MLVEADRPTARLIETNAATAGLRVDVRAARAATYVSGAGRAFDLVFLDPPYDVPTEEVESLLAGVVDTCLAPRGLVVVERSGRNRAPDFPEAFTDTWQRSYGETTLYFGALD